ncbi:GrpB family protein [Kitasatospora sp. NPDC058162]|uniref:GrpB family protein n=1 Tax=Kitasatospora sp. NPDC058162 TaxID=3346362 RepID=UPI0036DE0192
MSNTTPELDEPIHVVPYDPTWAALGRALAERLAAGLRGLPGAVGGAVEVEHIGSTSVPGLAAKPVLDVQVGCAAGDVEAVAGHVRGLGFEDLGESGVPGRRYLRRRSEQSANVHVVALGGRLWADNLLFRDHLRAHPEAAARYARAKREAAGATGRLLAYSEHKAATVAELLAEARAAGA